MAKFKPGDLVVLKHYARIDRWPDYSGEQQPLQDAILQKTPIRYVCQAHEKDPYVVRRAKTLPQGWLAPGEVGVVKSYEYVYMLDCLGYEQREIDKGDIPQALIDKAIVCEETDRWAKLRATTPGSGASDTKIKKYYIDRRDHKYMLVAIDGKLVAFHRGSYAFESSKDAGDRFDSIEVFYSFREQFQNMSEKERVRETNKILRRQRLERLRDPEITRVIYTQRDGTTKEVDFTGGNDGKTI